MYLCGDVIFQTREEAEDYVADSIMSGSVINVPDADVYDNREEACCIAMEQHGCVMTDGINFIIPKSSEDFEEFKKAGFRFITQAQE